MQEESVGDRLEQPARSKGEPTVHAAEGKGIDRSESRRIRIFGQDAGIGPDRGARSGHAHGTSPEGG